MRPLAPHGNAHDQVGALDDFIRRMEEMVRTSGWKEFEAFLQREEDAAFADMRKARTGDAALAASTAFHILRTVREMPATEMRKAAEQVASIVHAQHNR